MKRLISCLIIAAMLLAALPMAVFAGETDTQEKAVDYIGYQVKDDDARLVFGIKNTDISALTGLGAIIKNQLDGTSATVTNCSTVFKKIFAGDTEFVASTEGYDYVYLIVFADMFKEMDTFDFVINAIYTTSQGMYQAGERTVENIDQSEYTTIYAWSEITSETGKYRLDKNSTFTSSASITSFSGSLDGNGKTVTTYAPLFESINGAKISNLTIEGGIVYESATRVAALAINSSNSIVISNVTNNATVTLRSLNDSSTNKNSYGGGLVSYATNGATFINCSNTKEICIDNARNISGIGGIVGYAENGNFIATNCQNTGKINSINASGGNVMYAGGLVGQTKVDTATFNNCTNKGELTSSKNTYEGYYLFGGILGCSFETSTLTSINIFKNCVNEGNLKTQRLGGGIAGAPRGSSTFENCINKGKISVNATDIATRGSVWAYAAGIVADVRDDGSTTNGTIILSKCINNGLVEFTHSGRQGRECYAGGLVGANYLPVTITDCAVYSDVSVPIPNGGSTGHDGVGRIIARIQGNVTVNNVVFVGTLTGTQTHDFYGRMTSSTANVSFTNCYAVGINDVTVDALKGNAAKATLVGFDFDKVWATVENNYPVLK